MRRGHRPVFFYSSGLCSTLLEQKLVCPHSVVAVDELLRWMCGCGNESLTERCLAFSGVGVKERPRNSGRAGAGAQRQSTYEALACMRHCFLPSAAQTQRTPVTPALGGRGRRSRGLRPPSAKQRVGSQPGYRRPCLQAERRVAGRRLSR